TFQVNIANFDGSEQLQAWVGVNGTCSDPLARGIGMQATCWLVSTASVGLAPSTPTTKTITMNAQDIVAHIDGSPPNTTVPPGGNHPEYCTRQQSDIAVAAK